MSIAKDLQIHSNVSIPKSQGLAEEFKKPSLVENDKEEQDPYIGKSNYRGFLIGSSLLLLLLHSAIMVVTVYFLSVPRDEFYEFFDNFEKVGNGYDIASIILLSLSLILISVAPTFGRKVWRVLFGVIIFIIVFYLSAFILRHGMKTRLENFAEYVVPVFGMFFTSSLALFINVLASKKKLNDSISISVSVPLFFILFYIDYGVLNRFSPKLWDMFLYCLSCGIVAFYMCKDANLMIKKRNEFYLRNDWFLGFVHLQTDWVFRFWYDLFVSRSVNHLNSMLEKNSHHDSFDTRLSLEQDIA